mgnify:CR=1 FL=1
MYNPVDTAAETAGAASDVVGVDRNNMLVLHPDPAAGPEQEHAAAGGIAGFVDSTTS